MPMIQSADPAGSLAAGRNYVASRKYCINMFCSSRADMQSLEGCSDDDLCIATYSCSKGCEWVLEL